MQPQMDNLISQTVLRNTRTMQIETIMENLIEVEAEVVDQTTTEDGVEDVLMEDEMH